MQHSPKTKENKTSPTKPVQKGSEADCDQRRKHRPTLPWFIQIKPNPGLDFSACESVLRPLELDVLMNWSSAGTLWLIISRGWCLPCAALNRGFHATFWLYATTRVQEQFPFCRAGKCYSQPPQPHSQIFEPKEAHSWASGQRDHDVPIVTLLSRISTKL